MAQHLVITIRLHDARYHGVAEWPPSPARVFQALVAGVACANGFEDDVRAALTWLETLPPPIIAAPPARSGQRIGMFVPNNDGDTLGGNLARISEIRTKKLVAPRLIAGEPKFLYAWPVSDMGAMRTIERVADQLYQLGRGVDMAWALTECLDDDAFDARLAEHRGSVYRPIEGAGPTSLACPTVGSLASLVRRYDETMLRLRANAAGGATAQLFIQASKPYFVQVRYDSPPLRWLYELRRFDDEAALHPWPSSRATELVERIRDAAARRLRGGLPMLADAVDRALMGRKADGADAGPITQRVRILPLPSIGHPHADRAIRRVAVEVPAGGPLAPDDVRWAFSGLETINPVTGEVDPFVLTPSTDDGMIAHYVTRSRRWRTVTPAALPESARRRRIDPTRQRAEAKSASERAREEECAEKAVTSALRHAGVRARPVRIHVQREPFDIKGARAEAFADRTRFAKERLWHVEFELESPISGPLVLGDGRFLGLGLLAPVSGGSGVLSFVITAGLSKGAAPASLARALRRAVMSRVQLALGKAPLPTFFSSHDAEGKPAQSENASHLAFHFDAPDRLLILAPHLVERREPSHRELDHIARLDDAVVGLIELRAGSAGLLKLQPLSVSIGTDPLFAVSKTWVSRTPYTVNRHLRRTSTSEGLAADVKAECQRRGLPEPKVTAERARGMMGRGLEGHLVLEFPVAVHGPLVLGRSRYLGGGLFAAVLPS